MMLEDVTNQASLRREQLCWAQSFHAQGMGRLEHAHTDSLFALRSMHTLIPYLLSKSKE